MQKRLSLIMAMFAVSASLIACGVQETATQESPTALAEEVTQVSEVETIDTATADTESLEKVTTEAEKTNTEASVAEPTAEPTPEPTPEPNPYEGIDMESTLPGKEWVATFFGVIEEPVAMLINDETNKKVFLENGGDVYYEEGDLFVVYLPDADMWIEDYNGIRTKDGMERYNRYYNSCSFEKEHLDRVKNFSIIIDNKADEKAEYIRLSYKFQPMQ